MSQAITELTLIVDRPCIIKVWLSDEWLYIYRSLIVTEDDLPLQVKQAFERPHYTVVHENVEDPNIMFGEGVLSVYRFHG